MKRFACLLHLFLAALLFQSVAHAQAIPLELKGDVKVVKVDKVIVVKEDLTVVQSFPLTIASPAGAGLYFWTYPTGISAVDRGDHLEITSAPKGSLTISVKSISAKLDKDGKFVGFATQFGSITFAVGDVPTPMPPTPPDPPKPPDPPPSPAPIPLLGYRVLFIEETSTRTTLPGPQFNAMFGKASRDWLDATCTNEANQPGYRIYDKDATAVSDAQQWPRDALKRARPANFSVPWVIISNGKTGFEGPLPTTETEIKALLQKYVPTGGNR